METQAKRPAKTKWGISILLLILGLIVGTAFGGAANVAKLLHFGVDQEEQNSQVVNAITRQEKVVLLKLGMQGIASKSVQSTILGVDVPGTARALYLQYNYSAMLGIDGSGVTVTPEAENTYRINVPAFEFLGHSDVEFKKAIDELSLVRIDTVGQKFDPELHEAVAHEVSEAPEGEVIKQWSCGYKLGERLIRPAKVVVSSGPAKASDGEA